MWRAPTATAGEYRVRRQTRLPMMRKRLTAEFRAGFIAEFVSEFVSEFVRELVNVGRSRFVSATLALAAGTVALVMACAPSARMGRPAGPASAAGPRADVTAQVVATEEAAGTLAPGADRVAMIALATRAAVAPVSSPGSWQITEGGGRAILARGNGREPWRIEQRGRELRVAGEGNDATPWRAPPFVARAADAASVVTYEGRRYRGELWFTPTDSGILVVNRLNVEDYLRGVVPLELGTRNLTDRAALEAQAIAARSYTYSRVPSGGVEVPVRGFHMLSTVSNQVYGGVEAEHPMVDAAIRATAGLVLRFNGTVVDAPYHSTCGGRTAAPDEVWQGQNRVSYLQSVSDINEATGRPWCEISPRYQWTLELNEQALTGVASRALAAFGRQAGRAPRVQSIAVSGTTGSGRVRELTIQTDAGGVKLAPREIREVFRDARGAILSSTYFTVERAARTQNHLSGITLRGTGNGHGVGMCQWGAIARARAGQSAQAILRHYYPGTVVGFAD